MRLHSAERANEKCT